jgi:ribosomal protein L37AE/L43A
MANKLLLTSRPQLGISTTMSQSMMSKHLCPHCSDVLLRHVRLGELYWRCSYCYQEMPV